MPHEPLKQKGDTNLAAGAETPAANAQDGATESAFLSRAGNTDATEFESLDSAREVLDLIERVRRNESRPGDSRSTGALPPSERSSAGSSATADRGAAGNSSEVAGADSGDWLRDASEPESIGRFRIIRRLGQGGCGIVFLARDPRLSRLVALKIPQLEGLLSPEARKRFLREGEAAAALNHPHVVPVYESGHAGPLPFLASAYCDGITLAQWLQERTQAMSADAAALVVATLADAVQHAHSRGVLHRDLKPSNVLLEGVPSGVSGSERDVAAAVRISDFGLARMIERDDQMTRTSAVLGTPAYMSPEQVSGVPAETTTSSDVYSLGAILYELLTGQPPFRRATFYLTLQAVRNDEPVPPVRLRSGVPRDLESVCLKCLEKSPANRYASTELLANDLHRFLGRSPVTARHISAPQRLLRSARRHPLVAALLTTIVLLTVALAAGSTIAALQLAASHQELSTLLHREVALKQEALKSERVAQEAVFESRVSQALAVRQSGREGQSVQALEAIDAALQSRSAELLNPQQRLQLRNEVIAAMGLVDVRPDHIRPVDLPRDSFTDTDPECRRHVRLDDSRQTVLVCDIETDAITARLPVAKPVQHVVGFRFSSDGQHLGLIYHGPDSTPLLQTWHIDSAQASPPVSIGGFGGASDFTADGKFLVMAAVRGRALEVRRLPDLSIERTIRVSEAPNTIRCDHQGTYVACQVGDGRIEILNLSDGQKVASAPIDSYAYSISWRHDGRRLIVGGRDGAVRVFEFRETRRKQGDSAAQVMSLAPVYTTVPHPVMAVMTAWHPSGELFTSSSMDGVTILWDAELGIPLLTLEHPVSRFSDDGRWLGVAGGRCELVTSAAHQTVAQPATPVSINAGITRKDGVTSEIHHWEVDPQRGRLAIGQNFFQCVFIDTLTGKTLAVLRSAACGLRFTPDGTELIAVSMKGISRVPFDVSPNGNEIVARIGPPKDVYPTPPGLYAVSRDRTIVLTPFLGQPILLNGSDMSLIRRIEPVPLMSFFNDISADGRLVALGKFRSRDVEIRSAQTGELVQRLPSDAACTWFSPDQRLLAVAGIGGIDFYNTVDWQKTFELPSIAGGIWPCAMAFSFDSKTVAVEMGQIVRIYETRSFQPVAEFTVPRGQVIESLRFTPDNARLICGTGDGGVTHIWDLRAIRSRLTSLNLDWSESPPLPAVPEDSLPLRLELNADGLF